LPGSSKREAADADPKPATAQPGKSVAKEPAQVDPARVGEPASAGPALTSLPGSTPANVPASNAGAAPAALERIANMASVGEIPMVVSLPGLRPAVLAGEPAAVYEMAARATEGRGMPRDLKLAAKLFEKAAAHGLALAQYRIGNFYE
jgi:localization factor PodJL